MITEQILDGFTERQGWDDNTALDLALRYIENQGSPDAWRDFLAEIASEENAGTEFADADEPDDDEVEAIQNEVEADEGGYHEESEDEGIVSERAARKARGQVGWEGN